MTPSIITPDDSPTARDLLAQIQAMIEHAEQIKTEAQAQVKTESAPKWVRGNDTTVKGRKQRSMT